MDVNISGNIPAAPPANVNDVAGGAVLARQQAALPQGTPVAAEQVASETLNVRQQFSDILNGLGLSDTAENSKLLKMLFENDLPVTSGNALTLKQSLKATGDENAALFLLKNGIKPTRENVETLRLLSNGGEMAGLYKELTEEITEEFQELELPAKQSEGAEEKPAEEAAEEGKNDETTAKNVAGGAKDGAEDVKALQARSEPTKQTEQTKQTAEARTDVPARAANNAAQTAAGYVAARVETPTVPTTPTTVQPSAKGDEEDGGGANVTNNSDDGDETAETEAALKQGKDGKDVTKDGNKDGTANETKDGVKDGTKTAFDPNGTKTENGDFAKRGVTADKTAETAKSAESGGKTIADEKKAETTAKPTDNETAARQAERGRSDDGGITRGVAERAAAHEFAKRAVNVRRGETGSPADIDEALTAMKSDAATVKTAAGGGERIVDVADRLEKAVEFMNKVQSPVFAHVPVNVDGRDYDAELYVFRDKREKHSKGGGSGGTALVAVETAVLGRVEVYAMKDGKGVMCRFGVNGEQERVLLSKDIARLETLLAEAGYHLDGAAFDTVDEPFNVTMPEPNHSNTKHLLSDKIGIDVKV